MRKMRKMRRLLLCALTIWLAPSLGTVGRGSTVINGGFEEDMDGNGMADHWSFVGDAGVTATWRLDEGFVGQFSQKITCTEFTLLSSASHVMLAQEDTVQLTKGMWYKISFVAKQEGILSQVAYVAIINRTTWDSSGLGESFQVTRQWKPFEYVFQATETVLEDTRLQFYYKSIGSFWLDDVRLEPAEPVVKRFTEVVPPTTSMNLLPNSSFECGASGWGSITDLPFGMGNLNLPVGEVDTTTARFHQSSFKIALTEETIPVYHFDQWLERIPVEDPLLANQGWITVEPGADYTLSAYMKADSSFHGRSAVFSVQEAFRENQQTKVYPRSEWTQHSFRFRPEAEQIFVSLGFDLGSSPRETGTVWIDGVQLVKTIWAPAFQPRATVEVGLETSRLGNIFPYGGEPEMVATIFNSGQTARSVALNLTTTNFDDVTVHETTQIRDVPPEQTLRIPIDPGVRLKGFYRLHLRCEGAEVVMTRPLRFAIIEPYTKSDSLFGINHPHPWPHLLDLSKQIGIRWFRDWSLQWQHVEPRKGAFAFTGPDDQINHVLERGLNVLPLLPFPSNNWSSSAGPDVNDPGYVKRMAYMPLDLEEFATYVLKTVQHYQGRLGAWEILNEPIYSSYALPARKGYQVSDYVQLLQKAHQAVKAVEPEALVIGGIGDPAESQEFIEAGGLPWVDVLNLHIFPDLTAPDAYEEPLRRLRERMRSVGLDIPIWLTEGAYYADDDKPSEPYDGTWLTALDSEINASEWQIKLNTLLLAYGAERIIYHSGAASSLNDEYLQGIFFEWAGAPRKMLVTQSAMANLLSPPIRTLGPLESPDKLKGYGFESNGRTVIVAWAQEGAGGIEISLLGTPWQVVDLQGNELEVDGISLTQRPVYFVANGTMPTELPW